MTDNLKAWKFIIDDRNWVPVPDVPGLEARGCLTVAIAPDEATARAHVVRYAAENGVDCEWIKVARVVQIPLVDGAVLAWAEV